MKAEIMLGNQGLVPFEWDPSWSPINERKVPLHSSAPTVVPTMQAQPLLTSHVMHALFDLAVSNLLSLYKPVMPLAFFN